MPHPLNLSKANYDYEGCGICLTPLNLEKTNEGSTRFGICLTPLILKNKKTIKAPQGVACGSSL